MRVIIGDNVYGMTRREMRGVLYTAKKCVKHGIYAVEKDDICELKKEIYENRDELLNAIKKYKEKGFKVHYVL